MEAREYNSPFKHWVVRGLVPEELLQSAITSVPVSGPWITYSNALEFNKWTMEDKTGLSSSCNALLDLLASEVMVSQLSQLTGVDPLFADPTRRCAGLQLMFPDGYLATHLDAALHPSGKERRVNLVLFLNNTNPAQGGGLQLCDPMGKPISVHYPMAGEAVVWCCDDLAYHGVEPLAHDAKPRYTVASFYLGDKRPNATRQRALFLPNRR